MPTSTRTQVAIIGAGPAGLLLARLLHLSGVESVIVERRSRQYIEERQRAGVLEYGTVETLVNAGVGERLQRQAMIHEGIDLRFKRQVHRVDVKALSGHVVTVYAQTEIVRDLVAQRLRDGAELLFECEEVRIDRFDSARPVVTFMHDGEPRELRCDFIAGCDGSHGICRPSIPQGAVKVFERDYPFAWLGILADAPPASHEVIYAYHDRGFALQSMRSPSVSRLYLQCPPDDDSANWSDDRIWSELHARFETEDGFRMKEGPITQKSVTPMRSFVAEPMRYGRLFLAGDAAHIVPPTGAKGLNSAVGDVRVLAAALVEFFRQGSERLLDRYSEIALRRVWKVQHFASTLCTLLHRFDGDNAFTQRMQLAELDLITSDPRAGALYAHNYAGLPFEL